MFAEIQPVDVYAELMFQRWILVAICFLTGVQIVTKLAIFKRVLDMLHTTIQLLTLTEKRGIATDKAASAMEDSAAAIQKNAPQLVAATAQVVAKVEEVPKKVGEVVEAIINPPTVEHNRRKGDLDGAH